MITNKQYQRLMSEYKKTGKIEVSAMKADVHPQTARKYIQAGKPRPNCKPTHLANATRPFGEGLGGSEDMLGEAPELEAKKLFEHFVGRPDSGLEEGPCARSNGGCGTGMRRKARSRKCSLPRSAAGKVMQLDWTYANELSVTIQGGAAGSSVLPLGAAVFELAVGHPLHHRSPS